MIPTFFTSILHLTHSTAVTAGEACTPQSGDFLGLPKWWAYLSGQQVPSNPSDPKSSVFYCAPQITHLSDVWLIVAAIIEAMLRIAALVAIGYVLWGGIEYVRSQAEPGKTEEARKTIINALVGLVIAIGAATMVTYVAGQFN